MPKSPAKLKAKRGGGGKKATSLKANEGPEVNKEDIYVKLIEKYNPPLVWLDIDDLETNGN